MKSILALDLAAKTGWACWRPGETKPVWGCVNFSRFADQAPANPDGAVMDALRRWLGLMLDRFDPAWMGAERPWMPGPGRKIANNPLTLSRLHGFYNVAAGFAFEHHVLWRETHTSTVAKHFIGNGRVERTKKKAMTMEVCRRLGWAPVTEDEADALALLDWMKHELTGPEPRHAGPLFDPKRIVASL